MWRRRQAAIPTLCLHSWRGRWGCRARTHGAQVFERPFEGMRQRDVSVGTFSLHHRSQQICQNGPMSGIQGAFALKPRPLLPASQWYLPRTVRWPLRPGTLMCQSTLAPTALALRLAPPVILAQCASMRRGRTSRCPIRRPCKSFGQQDPRQLGPRRWWCTSSRCAPQPANSTRAAIETAKCTVYARSKFKHPRPHPTTTHLYSTAGRRCCTRAGRFVRMGLPACCKLCTACLWVVHVLLAL